MTPYDKIDARAVDFPNVSVDGRGRDKRWSVSVWLITSLKSAEFSTVSNSPSDLIGRAPGGRKLIAVVYADMVGYSRLIGLDDIGTLERLRTLRRTLIDPAINEHGGKIVQTGGDSLLIVFDSIDGAVRCAVAIQRQVPDYL
jgi:class 3 adenylate cyclase